MCVIIYKPAGVALPDTDTLRDCYLTNPDGAGFMYLQKGKVRTSKGHMTFERLQNALARVTDSTVVPMVLHFRIGTQGNNDATNCHPFPITNKHDVLCARSSVANVALAHNGIIPLTTYRTGGDTKEAHSDTFYFVRDYVSLIIGTETEWYRDRSKVALLGKLAASKLCILSADGHVEMIGGFEHDKVDGCWYSNKYHEWQMTTGFHRYYPDEDYASTASAGTVANAKRSVRASFALDGCWLYNDETGSMLDMSGGLYIIDALGNVYEYIDEINAAVPMGGRWSVVSDDLDMQVMDKQTAAFFTVYE